MGAATGAEEAVQVISRLKPEVIILDIRLKNGSGIDVLRGIRSDAYHPVVLVFTQYPLEICRNRPLSEGVRFCFDKATEFEAMLDTLKNLQRTKHLR